MIQRPFKASDGFTVYWLSLLFLGNLFSGCSMVRIVKGGGEAAVIHVAPTGSDTNPGTLEKPLATLVAAQQKVRGLPRTGRIIVSIADGSYYLDKPLMLGPADSGTRQAPVIWRAVGGQARLVGGVLLRTSWEKHAGTIWKTAVDKNMAIEQLFINEQRRILARYPNDSGTGVYNGAGPTWDRMKSWKNPETAYIHALHSAAWGSGHILIQRSNVGELVERIVAIDTTTQGDAAWLNETKRFAENVFEELDAPGEWFFDKPAGVLYYQPVEGEDLASAKVEAVGNPHLVMLEGTEKEPVRFVTFNGLVFAGAAPTWKLTTDHLPNGGDFVVHRGGALTLRGTEDCGIQNCTFSELGGNAVFLDSYNRRDAVRGCLIRNIGANGISLCGAANSMRGEEFFTVLPETIQRGHQVRNKWAIPVGWQKVPEDLVPGPKTAHYPAECVVEDNLITVVGELEKQSAGVLMSMTMNNTISHNTLFNLPRAGICVQDGAWGGHIIECNDVFDTVKETSDHGPFNSWGKDRYWLSADHSGNHAKNPAAKKNCRIDAVTPTHIRNNRFAHPLFGSHSWGIDLDDGSTYYKIYNNLCVGCAVKLREGFYRTVENNVFIGSGGNVPGKHVCFDKNEDVYRKNIVVNLTQAWVWKGIQHSPQEMKEIASNCYFTPGMTPKWGGLGTNTSLESWQKLGLEKNSIIADPLFVDPATGNYQVRSDSPALKLGFKNFPMDNFGVTSAKLRKLVPVRTFPVPGDAGIHKESEISEARIALTDFLGGKIKNMTTEAEKSAVGTGEISGVLVDKAPAGSVLAKAGFRVGDLIIKANGKKVDTVSTFLAIVKQSGAKSVDVQMYDDSQKRMLVLPGNGEQNVKWHGYTKTMFELDGYKCFVVAPSNAVAGNPWVWRTSFPDYHSEVDQELVARGYHIGFIDCVNMLGCDAALDLMDAFYKVATEQWKLAPKPALEPCSRGGLHAYRYAARRPERVACIYGDVPVMDLKSWPFKEPNASRPLADAMHYYGFKSEAELLAYKGNPIDLLEPIARTKIPLRHIIGLVDTAVPPENNTLEAKRRLVALGHDIELVEVKDGKHHFPLTGVAETVQFIMRHTIKGEKKEKQ